MISRAERTTFANWWWTIDRWLLAAIGLLAVLGIVLTMAGSPPVAERLGLSTFYFVHHQAYFSRHPSCRPATCAAPPWWSSSAAWC